MFLFPLKNFASKGLSNSKIQEHKDYPDIHGLAMEIPQSYT